LFCIAGIYLGNGYIYTTEIPRLILIMAFVLAFVAVFAERRIADAVQGRLLEK
jgi:NADH:ubiquinone oxidoreductase subunit H